MTSRTITLNMPEHLYSRAERAAKRLQRSVDEVLLKAVETALPTEATLPAELTQAVDALMFLNDAALWDAARSALAAQETAQLENLVGDSKQRLLTADEQTQLDALVQAFQRVMLVRAKAAVLLKTRGYDISELTTALPLAA